jgi:CheY-like chemotaxis protein
MFRRLVPENIALRVAPGAPDTHVRIDLTQLEMSLMNLVVNACEAMPGGGELTISTQVADLGPEHARAHAEGRRGPHVLLTVCDTGCGMDAATLEHVFEPFFTTRANQGGTGLGLATVFSAVQQAGGAIWVESAPGKGSCFTIALPRVDEVATQGEAEPRQSAPKAGRTILLVEDEPAVRAVTLRLLQRAGYDVLEASTGAEAIAMAERHEGPIHLLLSDMVMPGLDGQQVAEAVRARRPDVAVLLMSGYTDRTLSEPRTGQPPVTFLRKPVVPPVLLAKIDELLG